MERPTNVGLVWTDAYVETCVFTGEPLVDRDTTLELVGTGDPPDEFVLGWSEGARCWYGPLTELLEWCEMAEIAPTIAGPFVVDDKEQEAAVHLTVSDTTIPWADYAGRLDEIVAEAQGPPPSDADVRALPAFPGAWQLAATERDIYDEEGTPIRMALAIVTDADGHPRAVEMRDDGGLSTEDIADVVRGATRAVPGTTQAAARPGTLLVEDADLATRLAPLLDAAGIAVQHGETPLVQAAFDQIQELAAGLTPDLPQLIGDVEDDVLLTYLDATRTFYAAQPWARVREGSYFALQDLDLGPNSPWLYVNTTGQRGEEPGLNLFDSWLDVCSLIHGADDDPADEMNERSAGALYIDGVSLFPLEELDPADAERLQQIGAPPTQEDAYALPAAFTMHGLEASAFPLDLLTAILTAVPDALSKRRGRTVTGFTAIVKAGDYRFNLRYPATGAESIGRDAGSVRLTIEGHDNTERHLLGAGRRLVMEGPADTPALALTQQIGKTLCTDDYRDGESGLELDGEIVWLSFAWENAPGPTLDHVATAETARFRLGQEVYTITAERLAPGSARKLTARIA